MSTSRRPLDRGSHVEHDLRESLPLGRIGPIDALVHCAANVDERSAGFDVIEANARLTYNAVRSALEVGARTIVLLSSTAVYGTPPRAPVVTEESPTEPSTSYGLSKVLSEVLTSAMGSGARVVVLRLGYVLGTPAPERYFIRKFARAVEAGQTVRLRNADATRLSFVDTDDVAVACVRSILGEARGTYNLVGDAHPTVREVLQMVAQSLNANSPPVTEDEDPSTAFASVFPNDRAVRDLGLTFTPLAHSIEKAARLP